jgi:hypothetical protein
MGRRSGSCEEDSSSILDVVNQEENSSLFLHISVPYRGRNQRQGVPDLDLCGPSRVLRVYFQGILLSANMAAGMLLGTGAKICGELDCAS